MDKKIGVSILTFLSFLTWLFFAIYFSSEENWWSVITVEQTSVDTFIGSVSYFRVLVGAVVFTCVGFFLFFLMRRKS
ncbi:hypothetical protein LCL95_01045 [Bacillus timonensis]|nr:hypothetical protein [Bacillus timonensis]